MPKNERQVGGIDLNGVRVKMKINFRNRRVKFKMDCDDSEEDIMAGYFSSQCRAF
jgi:hypothetical protein